jgi:segregation and condensation protein B
MEQVPFINLAYEEQKKVLEAIIFSAEFPVTEDYLRRVLVSDFMAVKLREEANDDQQTITDEYAQQIVGDNFFSILIDSINEDLMSTNRPFKIIKSAGGWAYAVKTEYGELLSRVLKARITKRLSQASLEVLSIIAYKQPVSKPEIEQIRGVNSNEIVNSLIDKNLIRIVGRSDSLGKPLLYATTNEFLRTFGLNSLKDLPKLKEIEEIAGSDVNILPLDEVEGESYVEYDFKGFRLPKENELKNL